jgi:hypothetical protein
MGRVLFPFFMSKETYNNPYKSGEKNIDDLYKSLIDDIFKKSREEQKFQYVMKDIFEIMRDLGWSGDDDFEVQVAGTLKQDKFIVIKNKNLNPRPKALPEGKEKPFNPK